MVNISGYLHLSLLNNLWIISRHKTRTLHAESRVTTSQPRSRVHIPLFYLDTLVNALPSSDRSPKRLDAPPQGQLQTEGHIPAQKSPSIPQREAWVREPGGKNSLTCSDGSQDMDSGISSSFPSFPGWKLLTLVETLALLRELQKAQLAYQACLRRRCQSMVRQC